MTDRDGRMDAVRGDMDALLGKSALCRAPLPGAEPVPTINAAASADGPPRRRGVGIAALLLVGVASGVAIGGWPAKPVVAENVRQSVGGKAPVQTPAPIMAEAAPVEVPTLDLAAIEEMGTNDMQIDDPVERRVIEDRIVRVERPAPATRPAPPRSTPQREVSVSRETCSRYSGADLPNCLYDRLLAADSRLARAYEHAVDAGVPVSDLRMLRREWSRARRYSEDDPTGVAQAYDAIAADLRSAARAYSNRTVL